MSQVNIFSNYWDAFPNHKIFSEFSPLSSKDMWALYVLYNPSKSNPLLAMTRDEKKTEIMISLKVTEKQLLKLESLKEVYVKKILSTRAKIELLFYFEQLEQRRQYIEGLPYNFEFAEHKDKMLKGTKAIWDEFEKIKAEVDKEESLDTQTRGNRTESASEKKLI